MTPFRSYRTMPGKTPGYRGNLTANIAKALRVGGLDQIITVHPA